MHVSVFIHCVAKEFRARNLVQMCLNYIFIRYYGQQIKLACFSCPSAPFHKHRSSNQPNIFSWICDWNPLKNCAGFAAVKLYIHFSHISCQTEKWNTLPVCHILAGRQLIWWQVVATAAVTLSIWGLRLYLMMYLMPAHAFSLFKENTLLCCLQKDSTTRQTDGLNRCRYLREPPSEMENSTCLLSRTSFWCLTGSIVH